MAHSQTLWQASAYQLHEKGYPGTGISVLVGIGIGVDAGAGGAEECSA